MRTVFDDGILLVEVHEGKCWVVNKLSCERALLIGTYDGQWQLNVMPERWEPPEIIGSESADETKEVSK